MNWAGSVEELFAVTLWLERNTWQDKRCNYLIIAEKTGVFLILVLEGRLESSLKLRILSHDE